MLHKATQQSVKGMQGLFSSSLYKDMFRREEKEE